MINLDDVIVAIVKCEKPNGRTDFNDVINRLEIDDVSLIPFLKELKARGYIIQTSEDIEITSLGMSAYKDLTPKAKAKRLTYNFTKFTLQRFIDICIGIIIGLSVSAIAHHFGWQ